jgi:pyruvate,water dikinase
VEAQVPLVMALDDPGATPGVAGGKGASLARLARAGFRVPPGFHVTTRAYLDFAGRGSLRDAVLAAAATVDGSAVDGADAATFDVAAARIGDLFARHSRCRRVR